MRPLVSIIIVTYNSSADIGACLDALRAQTYAPCELIIYDNASADGTPQLVRSRYPEVKLIEGKENIGFAAACNIAARAATGPFLAFLNPDTVVGPGWLEPLVEALEADESAGAATAQILLADAPDRINACGNEIHLSGIAYCRGYGELAVSGYPVEVGALSGAAFVVRKELFERVGGLEASFFLYYEDADLSLRLRTKGLRCLAVPASRVYHSYNGSFGVDKLFFLERNRYLSLLSLLDWRILILMVPSLCVAELGAWGYAALCGRRGLAAKARAWRHVWKRRHWIKERRQVWARGRTNLPFLLGAFSARLAVQYVSPTNELLSRALAVAGMVSAYPMLALARLIGRLSQVRM